VFLYQQVLKLKTSSRFIFPLQVSYTQCFLRRRLEREYAALGAHPTDLQRTKLQEWSDTLQRKIKQWCKVQVLYMSMVIHVCASDSASTISSQEEKLYEAKLWLPSQLKGASNKFCEEHLCRYEWELQQAQAFDALNDLR
jgi:hypothetical protein